jgi:hypothetical protein
VRDFADGWILCATEKQARREARDCGNLVQPLFALPVAPSSPQRGQSDAEPFQTAFGRGPTGSARAGSARDRTP